MLLALIQWLADSTSLGWLRVFNYLKLRAVLAALTAFFIALALGPAVIRELRKLKVGQAVRQYGPKSHLVKEGTPTMGGILILIAVGVSTILWMDLSNRFVWVVLFVTLSFGAIGWVDDYRKVVHHDPEGMKSREKFFWQSLVGVIASVYLAFSVAAPGNEHIWGLVLQWMESGFTSIPLPERSNLLIPFLKNVSLPIGIWGFIILSYFVIVGTSNAVNLTDGLDGLAILPSALVGIAFSLTLSLSVEKHCGDRMIRLSGFTYTVFLLSYFPQMFIRGPIAHALPEVNQYVLSLVSIVMGFGLPMVIGFLYARVRNKNRLTRFVGLLIGV